MNAWRDGPPYDPAARETPDGYLDRTGHCPWCLALYGNDHGPSCWLVGIVGPGLDALDTEATAQGQAHPRRRSDG